MCKICSVVFQIFLYEYLAYAESLHRIMVCDTTYLITLNRFKKHYGVNVNIYEIFVIKKNM